MSTNKTTFYAVRCGHKPGVYTSWEEAKHQIVGYENPQVKKFETVEHAKEFIGIFKPFAVEVVNVVAKTSTESNYDWEINIKSSQLETIYDISKSEYPKPNDAILKGITEYLDEYSLIGPYRPDIEIHIYNIHVVNVINKYLVIWKENLWYTTRGPVEHVKTMKKLFNLIQQFPSVKAVWTVT